MLNALQLTANYSQPEESSLLLLLGSIHAPWRRTKRFEPQQKLVLILLTSEGWKFYLAWVIVIE